ncbi:MAG: GGDEF domain-containing protein [Actinomycetota bacterium]|nr:GGDEF domain-containing protein [Actinomycetota bacterium]
MATNGQREPRAEPGSAFASASDGRPKPAESNLPLGALVTDLTRAPSGINFIYHALDRLAELHKLRDAVVVLDDAKVGRQIFRSGRRSPAYSTVAYDSSQAPPGLYTDPELTHGFDDEAVTNLCLLALQLDFSRHDASHDSLTGLYNRRSFDTMLDESVTRSSRYGWRFVLALIDIDRFKKLNDRLGHNVGDQIIQTVGAELRTSLRGGDGAARIGGDEFALILHESGSGALPGVVQRLRDAVAASVGVEVGFSAGAAAAPDETNEADMLFRLADQRLYQSKRQKAQ